MVKGVTERCWWRKTLCDSPYYKYTFVGLSCQNKITFYSYTLGAESITFPGTPGMIYLLTFCYILEGGLPSLREYRLCGRDHSSLCYNLITMLCFMLIVLNTYLCYLRVSRRCVYNIPQHDGKHLHFKENCLLHLSGHLWRQQFY
jgi:hypothetical protein